MVFAFEHNELKALLDVISTTQLRNEVVTSDLDGTCLIHDAGEAVFYEMAREGLFELDLLKTNDNIWRSFQGHPYLERLRDEILEGIEQSIKPALLGSKFIKAYHSLLKIADKSIAEKWAVILLAGKTEEWVRTLSKEVLTKELSRSLGKIKLDPTKSDSISIATGVRCNQPVVDLIKVLTKRGANCWLVSASNQWTVEVCAETLLGIPRERVIGAKPLIKEDRIIAEMDPNRSFTYGRGKVEAIDQIIRQRPILAVGNSVVDWEMLLSAKYRLVAGEIDESLLYKVEHDVGDRCNWFILQGVCPNEPIH